MTKKSQSLHVLTLHSYHGSKTISSKSSLGLSLQLVFLFIFYTFIAAVSTFFRLITDKTWAHHVLIFLIREIKSGISTIYRCYRNTQHCKPKWNESTDKIAKKTGNTVCSYYVTYCICLIFGWYSIEL